MRFKVGTVFAGLLLLMMAAPAFAQSEIMHVNVPFAFSVGKKVMPAGQYSVMSDDLITYALRGPQSGMVLTNNLDGGKTQHQPSLIFRRSGSQYTLVQIWSSDGQFGHSVLGSGFNGKNMLASTQTVEVVAGQ